jgi:hypothetical protein
MMNPKWNSTGHRLRAIEIFEELYDELEFLAASYGELDDEAMTIFDLYESGAAPYMVIKQKWSDLVAKQQQVEIRSKAIEKLIRSCHERLDGLMGIEGPQSSNLRLINANQCEGGGPLE